MYPQAGRCGSVYFWGKRAILLPMNEVIARDLSIIGSHGMGVSGYQKLLALIAEGTINPSTIAPSLIPIEDVHDAMTAMGTSKIPAP